MRLPHATLIALFLFSLGSAWVAYPELPERMASHFGSGGKADGYSSKQTFFILFLGMNGFFTALFLGIPKIIRSIPPSLVNMPHKDYWLAPERLDETTRLLSSKLAWFGAGTMLLMLLTQMSVIEANRNVDPSEEPHLGGNFLWSLGAYFVYLGFWLVDFYRSFRRPTDGPGSEASVPVAERP